jgi:acyl-CoA thioesterase I
MPVVAPEAAAVNVLHNLRMRTLRRRQLATAAGAQVLLVSIPEFSAVAAATRSLSDHAMYEELGKELKVPVHAKGWSAVLSDPALRADPIHANARGYAEFAQGLAKTARGNGLLPP